MISERTIDEFISEEEYNKIYKFAEGKETPFLIINTTKVLNKYKEIKENLPFANIYYAIKANPSEEIIKILNEHNSNFDAATIFEIDYLLKIGISPSKISYGNTIKKAEHIKQAYSKGIKIFATDSISDIEKISKYAPGSKVFFRLLIENSGADWPLSRKFGCHTDTALNLIIKAKKLGLIPYGISFHVGSQQRDIGQWDSAIGKSKYIFNLAKEAGVELKMLNLGGGFPANYLSSTRDISEYCDAIKKYLKIHFDDEIPEIFIEPGRSIVADAGVIISEIILISRKNDYNKYHWVYLDIGKYNGLIETMDEITKYPIFAMKYKEEMKSYINTILAGPTCDSTDILYEKYNYKLPKKIKEGDRVIILTAGAYTQSYSSIFFNGIPPLKMYYIE